MSNFFLDLYVVNLKIGLILILHKISCEPNTRFLSFMRGFFMSNVRFLQRLENFKHAFTKITLARNAYLEKTSDELYQMAVIQSFEFTFELSWKTMKDYLKFQGIELQLPRQVIKESFAMQLIENGQLWIEMMEDRNQTSHVYEEKVAKKIVERIVNLYYSEIQKLIQKFELKSHE